jgi:hypothetical protein
MPFTQEQFFEVFRNYNLAVWPMQIVMYALGAISIWFAFWKFKGSDRTVSAILGFFWLWMGIAYFAVYNTSIYAGAWVYGLFFVIQGIVFLVSGSFQTRLAFGRALRGGSRSHHHLRFRDRDVDGEQVLQLGDGDTIHLVADRLIHGHVSRQT